MAAQQEYTREEVAKHNTAKSCWIIIDSEVLDVTKFVDMHPGGSGVILEVAGKEATTEFYGLHRQEVLFKYRPRFKIGTIKGEKLQIVQQVPGYISEVPYAESSFWMKMKSPYYKESHLKFRAAIRKIYDTEIVPDAASNEDMGKAPSLELYKKLGAEGVLASRIGPGPHLEGLKLPGGIKAEEFDYFHELIAHEENARLAFPGYNDGLGAGLVIGLPPVLNFGSYELKAKVAPLILLGEKRICLAITEPTAGSDVARIRATAKKTPDGKHYIVNGVKKWITNAVHCDFFSTAVQTEKGISMILIERGPGVETSAIKTSYSPAAGTGYIAFENVKVPVENLLGKEGQGFQVIMSNFNHERWAINCAVIRGTRLVVEECFKWANQREVFGKKLIEQPVIRQKLAHMIAQVESVQNWLESITYQMTLMSYKEQSLRLAGPIALNKLMATRVAHYVSDEACQIFGGRAITKTVRRHPRRFRRNHGRSRCPPGDEGLPQRQALSETSAHYNASPRYMLDWCIFPFPLSFPIKFVYEFVL
ncbi:acyl-CoA dehydrogenase/oxidase [Jimgerdemannia flammicorona]|uniref:Acyl-CoA dehydrogenase/oxidase n=1 Tax=Jimgerdemannia flammicorona TaxID=994334 RepID=A0A433A849_9FUNG|nr:acyl-CoA dehydrogenase/oxidase [Jimgerdemannia flammicorona]